MRCAVMDPRIGMDCASNTETMNLPLHVDAQPLCASTPSALTNTALRTSMSMESEEERDRKEKVQKLRLEMIRFL